MNRVSLVLALLTAATLAACQTASDPSSAEASASPPPPVTIIVEDSRFVPPGDSGEGVPTVTVPRGTMVTFRNTGGLRHTATHSEDGFPLPEALFDLDMEPGVELGYRFEVPGTYQVTCVPHPEMVLMIIVE